MMNDTESEANVPLVGCFANDTENLFTAGTNKNSGEKRHHGDYTHTCPPPSALEFASNILYSMQLVYDLLPPSPLDS